MQTIRQRRELAQALRPVIGFTAADACHIARNSHSRDPEWLEKPQDSSDWFAGAVIAGCLAAVVLLLIGGR